MPAEAKVNRKDKRIIVENLRRVLLKEYLMNETRRAGFGGLDIQRTPMGTRVTLLAERPGLVIGRKGGAIKSLTEAVERQFKFDNPQIEVQEVGSPALNAQIMAAKLKPGVIGVTVEIMDPRAKLPDEVEIKQPSAEYLAAAAAMAEAALLVRAEPKPEAVPAAVSAEDEPEEPEPLILEEPKVAEPKVKRGKVAAKR